MKYVLATANQGKIAEIRDALMAAGIETLTRSELGIDMDIEETGTTFLENATLKARAVCEAAGLPAIADDSGLMVEALDGDPGVYSSSYGGETLNDSERYRFLIKMMEGVEQRRAKFVCTIVCVYPDGGVISAQGECVGEILAAPRGSGGFGYDPVFLIDNTDKTMAELSVEQKNAISHRGKAVREFVSMLSNR